MLYNVMTTSIFEVFWPELNACQRNDSQLDTHVNVTEDVESFTKIDPVWLEDVNKLGNQSYIQQEEKLCARFFSFLLKENEAGGKK